MGLFDQQNSLFQAPQMGNTLGQPQFMGLAPAPQMVTQAQDHGNGTSGGDGGLMAIIQGIMGKKAAAEGGGAGAAGAAGGGGGGNPLAALAGFIG